MKLAEALILRADYQTRIEQIRHRLPQNVTSQEGSDPAEDPNALIAEMERVADDLADLIRRINRTNATAEISDGMTVSDALARRDITGKKQAIYREVAQAASQWAMRFMRSELRTVSAVDVPRLQQRADELAREYRELDTRIQEANWRIELVD
jgi:hypothetical protein